MSAITRTERGRVGTALIAAGALLLALASVMIIGQSPATASHEGNPPTVDEPSDASCFVVVQSTHNTTHTFGDFSVTIQFTQNNEQFSWVVNAPAGGSVSGVFKAGGNDWYAWGPGASGTTPGPILNHGGNTQAISQYKICGATAPEEPTTTTEAPEEPTTTTGAPEEPTTTVVAGPDDPTTTVVAGPEDPELPETGAGHILALMAGGLGLALMGSGSLVIAGERRRSIVL